MFNIYPPLIDTPQFELQTICFLVCVCVCEAVKIHAARRRTIRHPGCNALKTLYSPPTEKEENRNFTSKRVADKLYILGGGCTKMGKLLSSPEHKAKVKSILVRAQSSQ